MKKVIFCFALLMVLLSSTKATSQVKITGMVKENKEKLNLPGALVTLEGPSREIVKKDYADFDGSFVLNADVKSGTIVVNFFGYAIKRIPFTVKDGSAIDLGMIYLIESGSIVKDLKAKSSSIDIAKDRKTPIASSTIRGFELKERIGNKDFAEVTTNIPGVYTSKSNGSFSESNMFIRGYKQDNMALMVDGIPLSDVETGNIDWSGLMSINDAVSSVQLQRGLGASKLGNSSVAGTMNLILRDSDSKKGGYVFNTVGNDGFSKLAASLSTGRLKNGFSANLLLSNTKGDGYINSTNFEAFSYFVALGFAKGKHDFQVKMFGAPQWHNQRNSRIPISNYPGYNTNDIDQKYNPNWGYLNDKKSSTSTNYGHTPLGIFEWNWDLTKDTQLSTKLYGSTGTKGQTLLAGGIEGGSFYLDNNGQMDLDFISKYNSGVPATFNGVQYTRKAQATGGFINSLNEGLNANVVDNTTGVTLVSEINNSTFYGGIMNLKSDLTKNLTINVGVDGRSSVMNKTKYVNNLYGADGYAFNRNNMANYTSQTFEAKPSYNIFDLKNEGVSVDYNYDAIVKYLDAYGQLEYSIGKVNVFGQAGFNREFIERIDYKPLTAPMTESTGVKEMDGYSAKVGVNYNITHKQNIWANMGAVSRPPVFVTAYSGLNNFINPEIVNEKFESYEIGYGFRSRYFTLNTNVYLSKHKNAEIPYYTPTLGNFGTTSGINREHRGVELDFTAPLFSKFVLKGFFSYGDCVYDTNTEYKSFNSSNQTFDRSVLLTDGIKVGGAPQLMTGIGAAYELFANFTFGANVKYSDDFYSTADLEKFDPVFYGLDAYKETTKLPSFAVMDAFASYRLFLNKGKQALDLRFNMDNILNRLYIAESNSSIKKSDYVNSSNLNGGTYESNNKIYKGIADGNNAYFGFGRTWNFTVRYEF
jgi:hypothetical protein